MWNSEYTISYYRKWEYIVYIGCCIWKYFSVYNFNSENLSRHKSLIEAIEVASEHLLADWDWNIIINFSPRIWNGLTISSCLTTSFLWRKSPRRFRELLLRGVVYFNRSRCFQLIIILEMQISFWVTSSSSAGNNGIIDGVINTRLIYIILKSHVPFLLIVWLRLYKE